MLLKVKKRTRRKPTEAGDGAEEVKFDVEILGIVSSVYKFQGNCLDSCWNCPAALQSQGLSLDPWCFDAVCLRGSHALPCSASPGGLAQDALPWTGCPFNLSLSLLGMSDFQYLAMHSGPDGNQTSMYDKVLMLKPEKEEFFMNDLPLYIPPPIFSRLDMPADYYYRPETQHRSVFLICTATSK